MLDMGFLDDMKELQEIINKKYAEKFNTKV